ncbi:SRPBCC domain-containing protein [Shimia sp.]|uniref:SRPBCC domain-containing protein n=1 Tax=Shimia sp. TaxID=1954381 RepID=UPI003BA89805
MTAPIVKTITVNCTAQAAFDVFVRNTSRWWRLDRHAVSAQSGKPAQAVTIEPQVGGAVYETMHDGARSEWGRVLVFEPGVRFAMTWHPGSDPASPTEVSVTFEDLPGGQCRVALTHSNWENWADRADEMRGNYNGGWDHVFGTCFAQSAQGKAA